MKESPCDLNNNHDAVLSLMKLCSQPRPGTKVIMVAGLQLGRSCDCVCLFAVDGTALFPGT